MSETQETTSKKREKSKKMECKRRQKSTPVRNPDAVPMEKVDLKRKNRDGKQKHNKNNDGASTLPEKKPKNKDTKDKLVQIEQPSGNDKKEIIEPEGKKSNNKEKLIPSDVAESNKNSQSTNDPAILNIEENLAGIVNEEVSQPLVDNSGIQILEISVIDMIPPEIQQIDEMEIPETERQIPTEGEVIHLAQGDDGVFKLVIEETKNNEVSLSQETLDYEPEIPPNSDDPKPDESAPQDGSSAKEDDDTNEESKTDKACKGVDLPDQWFLDCGFPAEKVAQWKNIFRTSEPVPFDTASTSRLPE